MKAKKQSRKRPLWCSDKPFDLPVDLTFVPGGKGLMQTGGYGASAGYTVRTFSSLRDAKKFMKAHPDAQMPSWQRIDKEC